LLHRFPALRLVTKLYDVCRGYNVAFRSPLGDKEAVKLARLLVANRRLQYLRFYKGDFSADGISALAGALQTQNRVLEMQLWENQKVNPSSLALLLSCQSLKTLSLHHNCIDEHGALVLATALPASNVSQLYLGNNEIGDNGLVHLAKCINSCKYLTSLGLSSNNIGDRGVVELSAALHKNITLRSLYLAWNLISSSGAQALLDALDFNKVLSQLLLSGNGKIDTELIYVLGEAIKVPRRRIRQTKDQQEHC